MDSGDEDDFIYDDNEDLSGDENEDFSDVDNYDFDSDDEVKTGAGVQSTMDVQEDDNGFSYEVLNPESIVDTMNKCIDEVNRVFEIPSATARLLLVHFKWNKEKLLERYYSGDRKQLEQLFKEAHAVKPITPTESPGNTKTKHPFSILSKFTKSSTCDICIGDYSRDKFLGLECQHEFCEECWNSYMKTKILTENSSEDIYCPATDCDILVDEKFALSILKEPRSKARSRYHRLMADSFVQSNRLMRWCPAPGCSNAIKADSNDAKAVTCLCGFVFCFGCVRPSHEPVQCSWLQKWLKKCSDDSETYTWISVNTKQCPKCNSSIEKNGGCNHMTCRISHCKHEFCWLCMADWKGHSACNRYDEGTRERTENDAIAQSRRLERYLFYYDRYQNHMKSSKLEQKLYEQVAEKMVAMQEIKEVSWIDVQFLKQAVDALIVCRNTLTYTYVFAFILKKNNQSIIFEDNQKDLEEATEHLSGYLERDLDTADESVKEMKTRVQDKFRYCEQRRQVLLRHVYQGYEDDYWEYQEDHFQP